MKKPQPSVTETSDISGFGEITYNVSEIKRTVPPTMKHKDLSERSKFIRKGLNSRQKPDHQNTDSDNSSQKRIQRLRQRQPILELKNDFSIRKASLPINLRKISQPKSPPRSKSQIKRPQTLKDNQSKIDSPTSISGISSMINFLTKISKSKPNQPNLPVLNINKEPN